jgi:hypothetical protein
MFSLQDVGKECGPDNIDVKFTSDSVELRLRGYKGQNYIFAIKKLFADIITSDSKYTVKNNMVTLTLVKKDSKSWSQLPYKDEKVMNK